MNVSSKQWLREKPAQVLSQPQNIFILLAAVFGLIFVFLIPPCFGPDEHGHYMRADTISRGVVQGERLDDNHAYGTPVNVQTWNFTFDQIQLRSALLHEGREVDFPYRPALSYPDTTNETELHSNSSYLVYPPTVYAAHSAGIFVGRLLTHDIYLEYLFGRLFGLAAFIALGYCAIRTMPFGKWLLCAVLALPSAVYTAAMFSADSLTNPLIILLIAYCFKLSFGVAAITRRNQVLLGLLVLCLAMVKISYLPVAFLVVMIPLVRADYRKPRDIVALLVPVVAVGVLALLWMQGIRDINPNDWTKSWEDYQAQQGNYLGFVADFVRSIARTESGANLIGTSIHTGGHSLPWYGTLFGVVSLVLAAIGDPLSPSNPILRKRLLIGLIAIILLLTIILMNYALFTAFSPNESSIILGIQGRYFVALLPLFAVPLLLIRSDFAAATKQSIQRFVAGAAVLLLLVSVALNYQLIY